MDLTSTSSCETNICDVPDCECVCGDCTEDLVTQTCPCPCHLLEDIPLNI